MSTAHRHRGQSRASLARARWADHWRDASRAAKADARSGGELLGERVVGRDGIARRYWESAATTRLNSAHWTYAADTGANSWLIEQLKTLRARSLYEYRNNPLVAGACQTYVLGVVGERAPSLQIQSSSKRFAKAVEAYWEWRCDRLDVNGLSFYDLLAQSVGLMPTCGEYFLQITRPTEPMAAFGVLPVEPRRIEGLISFRAKDGTHTILGIKRGPSGKPLAYTVRDWDDATGAGQFRYREVSADDMIHDFDMSFPGQARGFPMIASALDAIAELRDFDSATLRAARTAAEHTVLLEATGPDVEYQEVDSEIEIEPGTISTIPPGYKMGQLKPEHPGGGYIPFRHERAREIGRPLAMPLMMVLLDSQNMNYSSARFDGQMFARTTASRRKRIEDRTLRRLLDLVVQEGQALGEIPAAGPRDWRPRWDWQPLPHVDPKKEAEAAASRLDAQLTTHTRECAAVGLDYEQDVLDVLKREKEARIERGLEAEAPAEPEQADAADQEPEPEQPEDDPAERLACDFLGALEAAHARQR